MLINLTVVARAHPDMEIGKAVRGRGLLVPPGDAAAFTDAVTWLVDNAEERKKLGMVARELAVKELDRNKILSQFTEVINSL